MDAYMNNPSDWAFSRLEEKRRGIKYDYATLDVKQVVLVSVWSILIFLLLGRAIYSYLFNVPFVRVRVCVGVCVVLALCFVLLLSLPLPLLGWISAVIALLSLLALLTRVSRRLSLYQNL